MNLEIKEKFNNYVEIIENTEKMYWLKQINNFQEKCELTQPNKQIIKLNQDNCSCHISSGFSSDSSKKTNPNMHSSNTNSKKSSINDKIQEKMCSGTNLSNINTSHKDEELSLLEDDYFIGKTNPDNTNHDIMFKSSETKDLTTKTIGTEFQNIFLIDKNKNKNKNKSKSKSKNKNKKTTNESSEIKNKLEDIYNKIIIKNPNPNEKPNGYKVESYINPTETSGQIKSIKQIKQIKPIDILIKKISELVEYVYEESIRGWNNQSNVYILQIDKLKENFEKVIYDKITIPIKMGFIYRDFNEPKVYLEKDFTKYWVGFDIEFDNQIKSNKKSINMIQTKYSIKNKILFYCLKNLTKSNKFKKKISKWNYKFIKKTIQLYGNKNLFIDIILFLGIKYQE